MKTHQQLSFEKIERARGNFETLRKTPQNREIRNPYCQKFSPKKRVEKLGLKTLTLFILSLFIPGKFQDKRVHARGCGPSKKRKKKTRTFPKKKNWFVFISQTTFRTKLILEKFGKIKLTEFFKLLSIVLRFHSKIMQN